uniref:Uncharacterized protein n=1 Tax=Naja naja TaxID=35670 RepID=A0A8C6Y0T4_NAJNA
MAGLARCGRCAGGLFPQFTPSSCCPRLPVGLKEGKGRPAKPEEPSAERTPPDGRGQAPSLPPLQVKYGDQEKDYVHLRIFQALPVQGGQVELTHFQLDKTKDDPITYF